MKRANSAASKQAALSDIPLPKAPDPNVDPAAYLRSIYAVRDRSRLVLEKAKRNQLRHFDVDMTKFSETARYVVSIIKVCPTIPLLPNAHPCSIAMLDSSPPSHF
jgi:hypothetical protein